MSEKYKSRKNEPVYSSTYDNGGWPKRDSLPTKDPIGDVDEPDTHVKDALRYATAHQAGWKKDQEIYEASMKPHLLNSEGKIFGMSKAAIKEFAKYMGDKPPKAECIEKELKCNCGTYAVYGKVPVDAHRSYCDLFRAAKNDA